MCIHSDCSVCWKWSWEILCFRFSHRAKGIHICKTYMNVFFMWCCGVTSEWIFEPYNTTQYKHTIITDTGDCKNNTHTLIEIQISFVMFVCFVVAHSMDCGATVSAERKTYSDPSFGLYVELVFFFLLFFCRCRHWRLVFYCCWFHLSHFSCYFYYFFFFLCVSLKVFIFGFVLLVFDMKKEHLSSETKWR